MTAASYTALNFIGKDSGSSIPPDPAPHGRHVRAQRAERRQLQVPVQRVAEQRRLDLQRLDVGLDAALFLGARQQPLEGQAQLRARKLELRAWREVRLHAATALFGLTSANAAIAAALPCAIESSMVSGPVAAPATNTPAREVSPEAP